MCAVPLDALDSDREWRVEKINLLGNKLITGDDLRAELLTKERPWYLFWGERPTFDPVTFESDLERLRRYYEARGYYDIAIDHDIAVDEDNDRVTLEIRIKETQPVIISAVDVAVVGDLAPSERPALPGDTAGEKRRRVSRVRLSTGRGTVARRVLARWIRLCRNDAQGRGRY